MSERVTPERLKAFAAAARVPIETEPASFVAIARKAATG
jgi:hypothetical protein